MIRRTLNQNNNQKAVPEHLSVTKFYFEFASDVLRQTTACCVGLVADTEHLFWYKKLVTDFLEESLVRYVPEAGVCRKNS